MTFKVVFTKDCLKSIKKMDKSTSVLLMSWIKKNLVGCENPRIKGKPLSGDLKELWRYRVGDYRMIAEIKNKELIIILIKTSHRKNITLNK